MIFFSACSLKFTPILKDLQKRFFHEVLVQYTLEDSSCLYLSRFKTLNSWSIFNNCGDMKNK